MQRRLYQLSTPPRLRFSVRARRRYTKALARLLECRETNAFSNYWNFIHRNPAGRGEGMQFLL